MSDLQRKINRKKRTKQLTVLKYKAIKISKQIDNFMKNNNISTEKQVFAKKLSNNLMKCSNVALYKETQSGVEIVSAFGCKSKLCPICNARRATSVRRKYIQFFNDNQKLSLLKNEKTNNKIITTQSQIEKYTKKGYKFVRSVDYDIMHLTLTVEHNKKGYKGQKYYYKEIIKDYNEMRKRLFWRAWVYGGEYGLETTKNENGYHIHIHSLLFVRQFRQNRNFLHKEILKAWNNQTAPKNAPQFTDGDRIWSILGKIDKESGKFKFFNRQLYDPNWIIKNLRCGGSTLIGLANIFSVDKDGTKHYGNKSSDDIMKAVMETLKYHYKPQLFTLNVKYDIDGETIEQKTDAMDIESMIDILPKIHKQILYRKFGCLHGEKSLNVNENPNDIINDIEESAEVCEIINEETGEVTTIENARYFVTMPTNIKELKDGKNAIKDNTKINDLQTEDLNTAIRYTTAIYKQTF